MLILIHRYLTVADILALRATLCQVNIVLLCNLDLTFIPLRSLQMLSRLSVLLLHRAHSIKQIVIGHRSATVLALRNQVIELEFKKRHVLSQLKFKRFLPRQ